jgi:hypothetical protein
MFPKKCNGPIKVAHCGKIKYKKRLCVQPAQVTNTTHKR